MRHTATCDDCDSLGSRMNDFGDFATQRCASLCRWKRWHVDIRVNGYDGNITICDHIFEWYGKGVPEHGVFRVCEIEVCGYEFVEQVFCHLTMDWKIEASAGELSSCATSSKDRERRH